MKKSLFLILFTLTAIISYAQDEGPKEISLTPSERELVTSNNDFAFNLFRKAHDECKRRGNQCLVQKTC